jgi:hypothetical protein
MSLRINQIVILFLAFIIIACNSNDTTSSTVSSNQISIRTLSKSDNSPISSVYIYTVPPTETGLTDKDGRLVIKNLEVGEYTVFAEKKGYNYSNVSVSVSNDKSTTALILLSEGSDTSTTTPLPVSDYIGYYPFDGNALDISSNGYNGTPLNVYSTTNRNGKSSSAFSFSGSSISYVDIPYYSAFNDRQFSISLWFKTGSSLGSAFADWVDLLGKWGSSGASSYCIAISQSTGKIIGATWDGSRRTVLFSNTSVDDNIWHNVILVRVNTSLMIYIDGVLSGSDPNSYTPQISINPIRIGARLDGNSAFQGSIDEVIYFNRSLTPTEILKISKY